jgi:hypothetical protein
VASATRGGRARRFSEYLKSLSAVQRLNIARERLERAQTLTHANICLAEQRRSFLRQVHGIDWRQNRAFETLLITVMYFEVVHICRLWEPPDPVGFSIPTLAGLVDDAEVLVIAEREIVEALAARPADRIGLATENIRQLRQAIERTVEVEGSAALERLRNHRDKEVAHAILWTAREKAGPVALAKSTDADAVLEGTVDIMSTVAGVAGLTYHDFRNELASERATAQKSFNALRPALRAGAAEA